MESKMDESSVITTKENEDTRRRLAKALKVVEKFKKRCLLENEVNKELANRNELLRSKISNFEKNSYRLKKKMSDIEGELNKSLEPSDFSLMDLEELKKKISDVQTMVQELIPEETSNNLSSKHNKQKQRRASTILVNLPDIDGSSLLRKSIHIQGNDENPTIPSDSNEIRIESTGLNQESKDLSSSSRRSPDSIPLFEHFLVIGASVESSIEFANQLQIHENDTLSNRLKKTFDGIFNSPKIVGNIIPNAIPVDNSKQQANPYFSFLSRERKNSVEGLNSDEVAPSVVETGPLPVVPEEPERTKSSNSTNSTNSNSQSPAKSSLLSFFSPKQQNISKPLEEKTDKEFESFVESLQQDTNDPEEQSKSCIQPNQDNDNEEVEVSLNENSMPSSVKSNLPPSLDRSISLNSISNVAQAASGKMAGLVASSSALKSSASGAISKVGGLFSKFQAAPTPQSPPPLQSQTPNKVLKEQLPSEEPIILPRQNSSLSISERDSVISATEKSPLEDPHDSNSILNSNFKTGKATLTSSILYRYPPQAESPPPEVCEFCLPSEARLSYLSLRDDENQIEEILFRSNNGKRSSRCFIFLLDNNTVSTDIDCDSESGKGLNRLYGICMLHPRLIRTNIPDLSKRKIKKQLGKDDDGKDVYEFESLVCYSFITRFPFFDFFFQVLYDLISFERLKRMEVVQNFNDSNLEYSKSCYQYLPQDILSECLDKLATLSLPKYGESLEFRLCKEMQTIKFYRDFPSRDVPEHDLLLAEWCLPVLYHWLPPECIVWSLGMLLTECRVIVIGQDAGMISTIVLGLLLMLRPFEWVSPAIPVLPLKLTDFVESPVPILAGYILDATNLKQSKIAILQKCRDSSDDIPTAVIDSDSAKIYIAHSHEKHMSSHCLPDSEILSNRINSCFQSEELGEYLIGSSRGNAKTKPVYTLPNSYKTSARKAQNIIYTHLIAIAALGITTRERKLNSKAAIIDHVKNNEESLMHFSDEEDDEEDDETVQNNLKDNQNGSKTSTLLDIYNKVIESEQPTEWKHEEVTAQPDNFYSLFSKQSSLTSIMRQPSLDPTGFIDKQDIFDSFLPLAKEDFYYCNHDLFLNKFINTQLFSQYLDRSDIDPLI